MWHSKKKKNEKIKPRSGEGHITNKKRERKLSSF